MIEQEKARIKSKGGRPKVPSLESPYKFLFLMFVAVGNSRNSDIRRKLDTTAQFLSKCKKELVREHKLIKEDGYHKRYEINEEKLFELFLKRIDERIRSYEPFTRHDENSIRKYYTTTIEAYKKILKDFDYLRQNVNEQFKEKIRSIFAKTLLFTYMELFSNLSEKPKPSNVISEKDFNILSYIDGLIDSFNDIPLKIINKTKNKKTKLCFLKLKSISHHLELLHNESHRRAYGRSWLSAMGIINDEPLPKMGKEGEEFMKKFWRRL